MSLYTGLRSTNQRIRPNHSNFSDENSLKILDSILNDNAEDLSTIVNENNVVDQSLAIKKYLLPKVLTFSPPIISVSAFFGASDCTSYLLGMEADLNKSDLRGVLPSHFAAAGGNLNIFRSFWESGELDQPDKMGNYAVHYAAKMGRIDILKYIWSRNGDKNAITKKGSRMKQPIHFACENGHIDVVNFLYEMHKRCIHAKDDDNNTPLIYASIGGHLDTVKFLLSKHANPDEINAHGMTAITFAAQNGYLSIVKKLAKISTQFKIANRKYTPLVEAAAGGHIDVVKYLIEIGVDPNIRTSDNMTPFWAALNKNRPSVLKYLLQHGAIYDLIRPKDIAGPLYFACKCNYIEITRLFLEENYAKISDLTAQDIFFILQTCSEELFNLLVEKGLDIFKIDFSDIILSHSLGISHASDIWSFIGILKHSETIYCILKLAEVQGITHYGPILEFAHHLNDKNVFLFLIEERDFDYSHIRAPLSYDMFETSASSSSTSTTSETSSSLPSRRSSLNSSPNPNKRNKKAPKWLMFKYLLENGGIEPTTSNASLCALYSAKMQDIDMIRYGIEHGVHFTKELVEKYGLLIDAILYQQETLFNTLLELNPDLNKPTYRENSNKAFIVKKDQKFVQYPLSTCLRSLLNFYTFEDGAPPICSDPHEMEFLLSCLKKLLEHGALFISNDFDNIKYVIGCQSDEIYDLVQRYTHLTKELIDKYSLLSLSITKKSKRYFDWFISFHPNLYSNSKSKPNIHSYSALIMSLTYSHYPSSQNNVFSLIDNRLPKDFATYVMEKIIYSSDTLEKDRFLYRALFYINDINILDEAYNRGITYDSNDDNSMILDQIFSTISSINYDLLKYLDNKGFDFSLNAKSIFFDFAHKMKCPSRDVISFFIEKGMDINRISYTSKTALQEAISNKIVIYAIYLLDFGANPNCGDPDLSCLKLAANQKHSIYLIYKLLENDAKIKKSSVKHSFLNSISYNHYLVSLLEHYNI